MTLPEISNAASVEPDVIAAGAGTIDARWIVTADSMGSTAIAFGHARYSPGAVIERHRHAHAEEVVVVLEGRAEHEVGGRRYLMSPGDVCFIPRMAPHRMANVGDGDLVILWAYGGAASLEEAGFEAVPG